jgi:hypothetical protein
MMFHLVIALVTAALGQPETVTVGGVKWRPTEPIIGDNGPLSVSQRALPVDMRVGSGFDRLYKMDAKLKLFGGQAESDYYMRMSGGVTAVFPRSSYVQTREGLAAEIPAGTVFSLGGNINQLVSGQPVSGQPATQPAGQPPARPGSGFIDRSARPQPPAREDKPGARPEPAPRADTAPPERKASTEVAADRVKSIWLDEAYRQQRLSELLDQALVKK